MKKVIEYFTELDYGEVSIYCRYDEHGKPQCKIHIYIHDGDNTKGDFHLNSVEEAKQLHRALTNYLDEYDSAFPNN